MTGVARPSGYLTETSAGSAERLYVVTIDDEPEVSGTILRAIGGGDTFSFAHFLRFSDFAASDLSRCDICIVDAFFGGVSELRRLIEGAKARWPHVQIIILSNFADFTSLRDRSEVFASITKPEVLLNPSVLRATVIRAIRASKGLPARLAKRAIESLLASEHEEEDVEKLDAIRLGSFVYPLRAPCRVLYVQGRYSLEGLEDIVGVGETYADARLSFARRFHEAFQRLRLLSMAELSEGESSVLPKILQLVDEEEYENLRTSIVVNATGQVICIDPEGKRVVRWVGDSNDGVVDVIQIEDFPVELIGLNVGDVFCAVVERFSCTGQLVRVIGGRRTGSPTSTETEGKP